MKHDNRKRNRLIACLMCAVLIGSAFYCIPNVFATTVKSGLTDKTDTKAYSEWDNIKPVNGNFEAGYAGKEVYGWHKTAFESSGNKKTVDTITNGVSDNRIKNFLAANVLVAAVEENGNKVASLEKLENEGGYVGVTSQETEVFGSETHRISFNYNIVNLTGSGDYFGVRLLVEELNANKETVSVNEQQLTRYFEDATEPSEETLNTWKTGSVELQTSEETRYIVIYLFFGVGRTRAATVYFDDVTLETYDDLNGTFDNVTYIGDGGRADDEVGPAGWTGVSCNQGGNIDTSVDANGWENNYIATVETESENNYLCHSLDKAAGDAPGYSLIQSPYIALGAGEQFSLQYDMKMVLASGTPSHKTRVAFWYYNANKERIDTICHRESEMSIANMDWTTLSTLTYTAPENTAYVKIGFLAAQNRADAVKYQLCYDNVIFKTYDTDLATNWSAETCSENGIPKSGDYSSGYGIRTVNEGAEHSEALQLYVKSYNNAGAVFYSQPMSVDAGKSYTTSFSYKLENNYQYYYTIDGTTFYTDEKTYIDANEDEQDTIKTNQFGASLVLRYRDADRNLLNVVAGKTDYRPVTTKVNRVMYNQDWKSDNYTFIVPEQASFVEVGLVIGSYENTRLPQDMMYTWDNIVLKEAEEYNEYKNNNDLLFKLTEKGNADLDASDTVDVLDLVMMKKYVADSTLITDGNKDAIMGTTDMNVNTLINNADIELLHWKLLGVDTETKAALVQGYKFY